MSLFNLTPNAACSKPPTTTLRCPTLAQPNDVGSEIQLPCTSTNILSTAYSINLLAAECAARDALVKTACLTANNTRPR